MRVERNIALALAALAAGSLIVATAAVSDDHRPREIKLDEGALPSYRWGMLAHRDRGVGGGQRPCVVVIIYFRSSWGWSESDDTLCGSLSRGAPPDILSYSFGNDKKEVTIFALAFEDRVATVELDLGPAETMKTHLHLVNPRQEKIARVKAFRYGTFAIRGPFCLSGVTGYSEAGEEIYHAPPEPCAESESQ